MSQQRTDEAPRDWRRQRGRGRPGGPPDQTPGAADSPALEEQSRTIDVIVRVPDPFTAGIPAGAATALDGTPPLLVGKFVDVEIQGLAPQSYFRVRRAALQPGNEIWVVDGNGAVTIVPVRTLQRGDDEVYVTGALQDGQAAITGGIQFATDGMLVRTGAVPGP